MSKQRVGIWGLVVIASSLIGVAARAEHYAIIFAGGGDANANYNRYYDCTRDFYNALVNDLGWMPENIYVLAADGTDPGLDQNRGDDSSPDLVNSDWSFITASGGHIESATRANLQGRLTDLTGRLSEKDTFLLWTYDHGGGDENMPAQFGEEWLTGWGDDIRDDQLAAWVSGMTADRQAYFFGQCYSGGMLDDLGIAAGSGRFGAAACNHYETSKWWTGAIGDDSNGYMKAINEAIHDHGNTGTNAIHDWAFNHAHHCRDGGQNGGTFDEDWQHPWRTGDNFDLGVANWSYGATTNNFEDAANWDSGLLPDEAFRTVRIADPQACVVHGGLHAHQSVIVCSGSTMTIRDGAETISYYLENDGRLRVADGEFEVAHTATGTDSAADIEVHGDGLFHAEAVEGYAGDVTLVGGTFEVDTDYTGTGDVYIHSGGRFDVDHDMTLGAGGSLEVQTAGSVLVVTNNLKVSGPLTLHPGIQVAVFNDFVMGEDAAVTAEMEGALVNVSGATRFRRGTANIDRTEINSIRSTSAGSSGDVEITLQGSTLSTPGLDLGTGAGHHTELTMQSGGGIDPEIRLSGTWPSLDIGTEGTATLIQEEGYVGGSTAGSAKPEIRIGVLGVTSEYRLNGGSVDAQDFKVLNGALVVNGGEADIRGDLWIATTGTGSVDQYAGHVTVNGDMEMAVMSSGSGTYNLKGGTLTLGGFSLGDPGGDGTLNIDGGTLELPLSADIDVQTLNIGGTALGDGEYSLGPRTLNAGTLRVGYLARGTLELNHDSSVVNVTGAMHVGHSHWGGDVEQSAGSVAAPELYLGTEVGGSGHYELTGGTVDVDTMVVGNNDVGHFSQWGDSEVRADQIRVGKNDDTRNNYYYIHGGTTVADMIFVGNAAGAFGTFNLDRDDLPESRLETDTVYVGSPGTGLFRHRDGTHEVTTTLRIGWNHGDGTYEQSGGELNTPTTEVGIDGTGLVDQTGGTHNVTTLTLGGDAHTGEYRLGSSGALNVVDIHAGYHAHLDMDPGTGIVTQTGGTLNASGNVYVGSIADSEGQFNQTGGTGQIANLYVGYGTDSTGQCALGDGPLAGIAQRVTGDVHLGYAEGSDGTYSIDGKIYRVGVGWSQAGELTVDGTVFVGGDGTGRLEVHPSAKLIANGPVVVGSVTDPGTLELDGGTVQGTGSITLTSGTGTLTGRGEVRLPLTNNHEISATYLSFMDDVSGPGQLLLDGSGDAVTFNSSATLDGPVTNHGSISAFSSTDTVYLNGGMTGTGGVQVGGRMEIQSDVSVRRVGTTWDFGTIVQHDGTAVGVDEILVGQFGFYELHETAGATVLTTADTARINGDFVHFGGRHEAGTLAVGGDPSAYMRIEPARYRLASGSLTAGTVQLGYSSFGGMNVPGGEIIIEDASAELTISEGLVLGQAASVSAVPGARIHMTGSALENYSTDGAMLAGLADVELIFEGGADDVDLFEVAGEDRHELPCGLRNNFALGTLTLGGADLGQIELADLFDNQPEWEGDEALYVDHLGIGAGSTIDLAGLHLYYSTLSADPGATIDGGSLTEIYMPTTTATVEGEPAGYEVDPTADAGGSGGLGIAGMTADDACALSCTFELDPTEVADAIAALAHLPIEEQFVTLQITYDEHELSILGLDETSLRPYWWDKSTSTWLLCGTTPTGAEGEGLFAGLGTHATDYPLGYCGLDTDANLLWSNINHASSYGAGGVPVPEPSTLVLVVIGLLGLALVRRRRRSVK